MKAIGLDIGTAFIASARYEKDNIRTIYVRDGFFKMDYVQQREMMLRQSKVPFLIKDRPNMPNKRDIYVIGNEAFDLAVLYGQDLKRPLKDGVISAKEPETEFILREIIKRVAGQGEPGDIAYYSIPADPLDREFNTIYHKEIFKKFLNEAGYIATPLLEGMALVYSDLEDKEFSGLAMSLGAGALNLVLAYRGLDIFGFSLMKGGDFIDENVGRSRAIATSDAAAIKESTDFDLQKPKDDVEEAITIFYKAMLDYALKNISENIEKHKNKIKLKDPLTFVYGGGTSMPKGFHALLEQALKEYPLPISIGEVRQAKNPVGAVCLGCLKAAQADLQRQDYDGVKDISGGENTKHQYPMSPKEEPVVEKKPKREKDKASDREKGKILAQGFTEAIDLANPPKA